MREFVKRIVGKQQADTSLETMNVTIEENKGTIRGGVRSEIHKWAIFKMTCVLTNIKNNGKNSGLLELSKLEITTKSLRAWGALKSLNVEENTRNDLQNPKIKPPNVNDAFKKYLNSQFAQRDPRVEINKLYLCFNKKTLSVKLK